MSEDSKNKKSFSFSDLGKKIDEIMDQNGIDRTNSRHTISDICQYLKIDEEAQKKIKSMPFTKIENFAEEINEEIQIIQLADLQGVTFRDLTQNAWNWLDQLGDLRFAKIRNYSSSFEEMFKFLNKDAISQIVDLPIVIKYQDNYYIEEGLHRLTIAKCLGIEKFKVVVRVSSTEGARILKSN